MDDPVAAGRPVERWGKPSGVLSQTIIFILLDRKSLLHRLFIHHLDQMPRLLTSVSFFKRTDYRLHLVVAPQ
jgi:hypothetical protein